MSTQRNKLRPVRLCIVFERLESAYPILSEDRDLLEVLLNYCSCF